MRGYPQFNFPAFDAAAARLRGLGHNVFNPADHDRATHGDDFADGNDQGDEDAATASHGFNLRDALGADLAFITAHADAVAVLPGWEKSKGATAEVSTALALGLIVAPFDDFGLYGVHDDLRIVDLPGASLARGIADSAAGRMHPVTVTPAPTLAEWIERTEPVDLSTLSGEVRSVSATGGEKGVKPARFDLLPTYPLTVLAEHYAKGAAKYDAHNWRRGYAWSNSFAALQRHVWAWWGGEDIDAETGSTHLAAVAFHAFALMQFEHEFPEFDDRYKAVTE